MKRCCETSTQHEGNDRWMNGSSDVETSLSSWFSQLFPTVSWGGGLLKARAFDPPLPSCLEYHDALQDNGHWAGDFLATLVVVECQGCDGFYLFNVYSDGLLQESLCGCIYRNVRRRRKVGRGGRCLFRARLSLEILTPSLLLTALIKHSWHNAMIEIRANGGEKKKKEKEKKTPTNFYNNRHLYWYYSCKS